MLKSGDYFYFLVKSSSADFWCYQIWRRSYDVPPPALTPSDKEWSGNDPRYVVSIHLIFPVWPLLLKSWIAYEAVMYGFWEADSWVARVLASELRALWFNAWLAHQPYPSWASWREWVSDTTEWEKVRRWGRGDGLCCHVKLATTKVKSV